MKLKNNKLSIVCLGIIAVSMIGVSFVTYNITKNGLNNNAFINRTIVSLLDFEDLDKNLTRIKLTKAIYIFGSIQNLNIDESEQYKKFCPYMRHNLQFKLVSVIEEKIKIKESDKAVFNKKYLFLNTLCNVEEELK